MSESTKKRNIADVNIGICIKDKERRVQSQDERSKSFCGDLEGNVCEKHCMTLYKGSKAFAALDEGIHLFKNEKIQGKRYDLVVINDGNTITTIQYLLEDKQRRQLEFLSQQKLSRREMEIMTLIIQGASNSDVCRQLSITRPTLRTHLGNIYRKLPAESRQEFLSLRSHPKAVAKAASG